MKLFITIVFCLLSSCPTQGREPNWAPYEVLLKKHISTKSYANGTIHWVNYSRLKSEPSLQEVINIIESFPTDQLEGKEEELSFYINAYNIFAIKTIIDKWPLNSIKDAGSFFVPVWHKKIGKIDGRDITLHHIENGILRQMGEPRIHFAVNCASISCPNLRTEPYTKSKLEEQLHQQTVAFLSDSYKGIRKGKSSWHISKIFKWFKKDFESSGGSKGFINNYQTTSPDIEIISDLPYNWEINGD